MMTQALFVFLLVTVVGISQANSPGFKARITDKGLTYANDVAMKALQQSLLKTQIPDQSGSASGFHYTVFGVRVATFTPPSSDIKTNPGKGLTWQAANANIEVDGNFKYKKSFIRGHGSFTAKFSDVNFKLDFDIKSDSMGRPTITVQNCDSSIGDVDFKFHGSASFLYNLFRKKVGSLIKNLLNKQMCVLITKEVNVDGAEKLAKLKVTTKLGKDYLLDYSLSKSPVFTKGFLETFHKGEIYWFGSQAEAPIPVPAMPDIADSNHMLFLWVSDYMCNTMMYNSQIHGALKYNLTKNDISPSQRGALDTSCEGLIPKCVGRLIPGINKEYPNSSVELHMKSTKVPQMKISASVVAMTFEGMIDMYANVTGKPLAFLVSLNAKMSLKINVSVVNELLYAKIIDLSVVLKTLKSEVGPVSDASLNFIVKEVLNMFLIPKLNGLGEKGFPLPMTGDFKFQNIKLVLAEDSLILATDIQYTPSLDEETLRFRPNMRH